MDQMVLFGVALEIGEPIYIKAIQFDKETGKLHTDMDFGHKAHFPCDIYGVEGQLVYDTEEKTLRHLNFFRYNGSYPIRLFPHYQVLSIRRV